MAMICGGKGQMDSSVLWIIGTLLVTSVISSGTLISILWWDSKQEIKRRTEQLEQLLQTQNFARKEAEAKAEVDLKLAQTKWSK